MKLDRRQALAAFGSVSLGTLLGACGSEDKTATVTTTDGSTTTVQPSTSSSDSAVALLDRATSCSVTPEQTEGPYYFEPDAVRSDIREEREGAVLRLALRVRSAGECTPVPDAIVDIWHCDAGGVYSGFGEGEGEKFLRGTQVTNRDGIAEFTTVYPGWYQGRTPHIHVKVHLDNQTVLTSQLYFDDEVSDRVYAQAPYDARGERRDRNDTDGIYDPAGELTLEEQGDGWLGAKNLDTA